jgi:phage tail sheath protein FI
MPTVFQTPGVYYERVDIGAPGVAPVRTDVAGFVGIATCGPLHTPVPVQSWRQFQAVFGEFTGAGYLAYAVRAFFENGGRRCWVVRVASDAAATAAFVLRSPAGHVVWRVAASSPGVWGDDLDVAIRETHAAQTLTDPLRSAPDASVVGSVTGFTRATHVRLSQDGAATIWKVVSDVDAAGQRLLWRHPKPEARLPYDADLTGFDPNRPVLVESVEYTLVVRRFGRLVRAYDGLSLIPEHARYGVTVLARAPLPGRDDAGKDPSPPEPIVLEELRDLPLASLDPIAVPGSGDVALAGGADGLALLSVGDFIGDPTAPIDGERRGLRALELIDEVSVLAVPDINIQSEEPRRFAPPPPCVPDPCLPSPPPAPAAPRAPAVGDLPPRFSEADVFRVQAEMIAQCERLCDRIALIDPPFNAARDARLGASAVRAWRTRFDSTYAALYFPWLLVLDPVRPDAVVRPIPPSGHVAGQIARTDLTIGVHKAPANDRVVWVQDTTVPIDDATHGALNPEGINAIRAFAGRGIRIFGARTVSSDPDWQFLNVRRLLLMIEKALLVATQWAVFEPNDDITRAKLTLSIWSFLLALWQRGAFAGASADEAFFVKCDEATNPPAGRDLGQLVALVGVAPSKPFEFVVVRIGRANNEFEITEAVATASGGR